MSHRESLQSVKVHIICSFAFIVKWVFNSSANVDGALCSGRSVILAAGPHKAVPGLKFFF